MPAQSTTTKPKYAEEKAQGQVTPFEQIDEQGAYVCNWSGHLLRIPEDAVSSGRSPLMSMNGSETLFVTKISDNPYIAINKARMLSCDLDLPVQF